MNEKQAKREEKRQRDYRAAIIQLANYRAKKVVEAALKDQGKHVSLVPIAEIRALAEAEFKLNWVSLRAEAEKTIATAPGFA